MQKQTMFQSFLKKKQLIAKILTENKSLPNKQPFKHFEALSEPVYIQAESNAIYLTHLNGEFKDQLRQFVKEQEHYNETMFQLANITECLEEEKYELEEQYREVRHKFDEIELNREILSDKNDFHLRKILALQQQGKTLQVMGEEHQKAATSLQQQIQYQTCMLSQIKSKNGQILQRLSVQTYNIQQSTVRMQSTQKQMRQTQSLIKKLNSDIKSIYFTLETQDDQLALMCTSIQEGLNKQNNHINDIQFAKDGLRHVLTESGIRKKELKEAQEVRDKLLEYGDDLEWELGRVQKELEIQEKGIEDEVWKIQTETQRLQQNHQMLAELQLYLQSLITKNQLLEHSLQQQIIQDYTIKKIVQSKTSQPVGKKTKKFLEHLEEKELADTSSSWNCKENLNGLQKKSRVSGLMSPKEKRESIKKQVEKVVKRREPQQMEFIFEKFARSGQNYDKEEEMQLDSYNRKEQDRYMSTGFTYIDKLARFQTEV